MKTAFRTFLFSCAFCLAVTLAMSAQAQNVLVPSTPTKTPAAKPAPTPAPQPATAPAADVTAPVLPSTPIPQASAAPQQPLQNNGIRVPPAMLANLVGLEKNHLAAMMQTTTSLQQQASSYDIELQKPQTPEQRQSLLAQKQSMLQSAAQSNAEMQKIQRRIAVLQSGNVSSNDLSALFSQ